MALRCQINFVPLMGNITGLTQLRFPVLQQALYVRPQCYSFPFLFDLFVHPQALDLNWLHAQLQAVINSFWCKIGETLFLSTAANAGLSQYGRTWVCSRHLFIVVLQLWWRGRNSIVGFSLSIIFCFFKGPHHRADPATISRTAASP